MTTVAAALAAAREKIAAGEARLLLGHVLGQSAAWLVAHDDAYLGEDALRTFASLVARRGGGEPVAYLVGYREFYGRRFAVAPGVLIPRPETELLVDRVLEEVGADGTPTILDLGSGSGCIAITLALEIPRARVMAVERAPAAVALTRTNAGRLQASLEVIESDWLAGLPVAAFDVIVSNPPYIAAGDAHLSRGDLRYEPRDALASGGDGLDAIRQILACAGAYLAPEGILLIEHGYDQGECVPGMMSAAGFGDVTLHRDLAGLPRVTAGRNSRHISRKV